MLKKGFVIAIVFLFIGLNVIASANIVISQNKKNHNILRNEDELDQYQLEMDTYGIIGREPDSNPKYYMAAQGFKPTKNILTRVELLLSKNVYTTYNIKLAIRDDLSGQDLISISKSPDFIPTEDFDWIEFDFENILVNPGKPYFIVCSTYDSLNNWYAWGVKLENAYPDGNISVSEDGEVWYIDPFSDAAFKTYGFINQPPEKPTIDGQRVFKVGESGDYTYNIFSTDPENDSLFYQIDWGDGNFSDWIGPYESGEIISLNITIDATKKGTFNIFRIKAKDYYQESPWELLEITVPKSYFTYLWLLNNLLGRFPLLHQFIIRIMER